MRIFEEILFFKATYNKKQQQQQTNKQTNSSLIFQVSLVPFSFRKNPTGKR